LSRCVQNGDFLDSFYNHFMASSEDIKSKFAQTDFDRQKKVLQDSLFLMMVAAGTDKGPAHKELEKLAERHSSRALDIKPEWYTNWLDCLLEAVSEHDPEYSPEIDASWRFALADGIELLKSRY
jgi:hemoglobin-like flavoprotein